jgi:predicted phage terminase large subunit-like protein
VIVLWLLGDCVMATSANSRHRAIREVASEVASSGVNLFDAALDFSSGDNPTDGLSGKLRRGDTPVGEMSYLEYYKATIPAHWSQSVPRHIAYWCELVDALASGEIRRLAVHGPPRHGKSQWALRCDAYFYERDNHENVLLWAHDQPLAERFSKEVRDMLGNRTRLPFRSESIDDWALEGHGSFNACGAFNAPVGIGFGHCHIEDVIGNYAEAVSVSYQRRLQDNWISGILPRLEAYARILMSTTEWTEGDFYNWLKEGLDDADGVGSIDDWHIVKLAAICESEHDPIGRSVGTALWEERWPLVRLEQRKKDIINRFGMGFWDANYQQRPTALSGDKFPIDRLVKMRGNELPTDLSDLQIRGWDLAASEEKDSAETASVKIARVESGEHKGKIVILDVTHGKMEESKRDEVMIKCARADGFETRIRFPQDPGAAGKTQAKRLEKMFNDEGYLCYFEITSKGGSKEVRADYFAVQVQNGNVIVPSDREWSAYFIEQLRTFPKGKLKDVVDAGADAFNEWIRQIEKKKPKHPSKFRHPDRFAPTNNGLAPTNNGLAPTNNGLAPTNNGLATPTSLSAEESAELVSA